MQEEWLQAKRIVVVAPEGTLEHIEVARTFVRRLVGLLARRRIEPEEGLMFAPGGSIHTCWMRCAIDVVFLSEQLDVLKVARRLKPWRFALAPPNTQFVLELAAGAAQQVGISPGELLYAVAKPEQRHR